MTDMVLTHGTVVTMNGRRRILDDGAAAIQGNKIVDVDKTEK